MGETALDVVAATLECRHTATVDDVERPLMLSPVNCTAHTPLPVLDNCPSDISPRSITLPTWTFPLAVKANLKTNIPFTHDPKRPVTRGSDPNRPTRKRKLALTRISHPNRSISVDGGGGRGKCLTPCKRRENCSGELYGANMSGGICQGEKCPDPAITAELRLVTSPAKPSPSPSPSPLSSSASPSPA